MGDRNSPIARCGSTARPLLSHRHQDLGVFGFPGGSGVPGYIFSSRKPGSSR